MGSFHLHGHHGRREAAAVPRGCLAVVVGQGEEQRREVVPVDYFNHPLFQPLLKAAEEEYGFRQEGPLNIPCHVQQFEKVKGVIDEETALHHHHHHHGLHHGLHLGLHLVVCFRA